MKLGFSLIELSIVLVILGLLVGGILAGQSLIHAAELRSIIADADRYRSAISSFRQKYFELPGDMSQATSVWGKSSSDCNGHSGSAATLGTCNGDGDGVIDPAAAPSATGETFQFWRQLSLSGLVEGMYSGLSGAAGINNSVIGTNVPRTRMSLGGWSAGTLGTYAGDSDLFAATYDRILQVGAQTATAQTGAALLRPEDAWNLDAKLDDGRPGTGAVLAKFWNNLCSAPDAGTASATNTNASYRVADNTARCALIFARAF